MLSRSCTLRLCHLIYQSMQLLFGALRNPGRHTEAIDPLFTYSAIISTVGGLWRQCIHEKVKAVFSKKRSVRAAITLWGSGLRNLLVPQSENISCRAFSFTCTSSLLYSYEFNPKCSLILRIPGGLSCEQCSFKEWYPGHLCDKQYVHLVSISLWSVLLVTILRYASVGGHTREMDSVVTETYTWITDWRISSDSSCIAGVLNVMTYFFF